MSVTDIGTMPAYSRPAVPMVTKTLTGSAAKYGYIVADAGTGNHDEVVISAGTSQKNLWGVVQSQGDPNNSNQFVATDQMSVAEDGYAEVQFVLGTVITEGDTIVPSATPGLATTLAVAGPSVPYDVLGYAAQTITIGAAAGLASVRLRIHREEH
jgi:hypothetical protein